jgi:hypothetical protein
MWCCNCLVGDGELDIGGRGWLSWPVGAIGTSVPGSQKPKAPCLSFPRSNVHVPGMWVWSMPHPIKIHHQAGSSLVTRTVRRIGVEDLLWDKRHSVDRESDLSRRMHFSQITSAILALSCARVQWSSLAMFLRSTYKLHIDRLLYAWFQSAAWNLLSGGR